MKKMWIVAVFCVAALLVFAGCQSKNGGGETTGAAKPENAETTPAGTEPESKASAEPVDFERLELMTAGDAALKDVIVLEKAGNGVRLSHYYEDYGQWDEKKQETVYNRTLLREINGGPELLAELQQLLGEVDILAWDGFYGANPPDVLDGSSMDMEAVLADGRTISAYGSNNFPENYGLLRETLYEMLRVSVLDSTTFTGDKYEVTLPEAWVGEVYVSYDYDFNAFFMKIEGRNLYLIRMDIDYYERSAGSDTIVIGKLVSGNEEDEELYISLHDYHGYMKESEGTAAQFEIYQALEGVIPAIADSVQGANGYTLVRE